MDGFSRSVARLSVSSQQGGAASCRAAVCPPPRPAAAPASAGRPQRRRFALGWGRRSVSRGPAALQTRRCTHARGIPARSRPPDSHRHPRPCAAPPCSSLKLLRRGVTSHGAGPATGRASPGAFGRRQWVGEAIARAASDRPTARHAGGSKRKKTPTNAADSPRSDARYERLSSAATLPLIPRVCPALLSPLLCERWPAAKKKL